MVVLSLHWPSVKLRVTIRRKKHSRPTKFLHTSAKDSDFKKSPQFSLKWFVNSFLSNPLRAPTTHLSDVRKKNRGLKWIGPGGMEQSQ